MWKTLCSYDVWWMADCDTTTKWSDARLDVMHPYSIRMNPLKVFQYNTDWCSVVHLLNLLGKV
jgi:hypothetical protein